MKEESDILAILLLRQPIPWLTARYYGALGQWALAPVPTHKARDGPYQRPVGKIFQEKFPASRNV